MPRSTLLISLLACPLLAGGGLAHGAEGPVPAARVLGTEASFHAERASQPVTRHRERGAVFLRWVTEGRGELDFLRPTAKLDQPVDLDDRFVRLRVRIDDTQRLAALELRLGSGDEPGSYFAFRQPIYEDELFNPIQSGEWLTLTYSFGRAEVVGNPDRGAIDQVVWVVRDSGPDAAGRPRPLTLDLGSIDSMPSPRSGIVSLTFDDGHQEHFDVAARLMAEHGFPGTAYVMPDEVGTAGYMTVDELQVMHVTHGWDIAAHHAIPYTDFPSQDLEHTIRETQRFLRDNGFGEGALHLAYPLGRHDTRRVVPMVRRHFQTARLAGAGPETLPPADPHRLRVWNVTNTTTPAEVEAAVRRAREQREWLILMFHYLPKKAVRTTDYAIDDFRAVLDGIARQGVPVKTLTDVWSQYEGAAAATP
jgi:peptidoglycan/xylan/chitin deacetylase (PgdA/CDA1 family)